jgi:hypothetical protein
VIANVFYRSEWRSGHSCYCISSQFRSDPDVAFAAYDGHARRLGVNGRANSRIGSTKQRKSTFARNVDSRRRERRGETPAANALQRRG